MSLFEVALYQEQRRDGKPRSASAQTLKLAELQVVLNDLDEKELIRMNAGKFVLHTEKLRANR